MTDPDSSKEYRAALFLLMVLLITSLLLPLVYLPFVDFEVEKGAKVELAAKGEPSEAGAVATEEAPNKVQERNMKLREPLSDFERGGAAGAFGPQLAGSNGSNTRVSFPVVLRKTYVQTVSLDATFDEDLTPYRYVIETVQEGQSLKRAPSKRKNRPDDVYDCEGVFTNVRCGADAKALKLRPISYVSKKWQRLWKQLKQELPASTEGGKRVVRIRKSRLVHVIEALSE